MKRDCARQQRFMGENSFYARRRAKSSAPPCAPFSLNVATCARPGFGRPLQRANPKYGSVEASPSRVSDGLGSFPASRPISCPPTRVHGEFKFCRKMEGMKPFEPHPLLRNPHAQTFAWHFWPRRFPRLPRSVPREFEIEPGTRIRGECHWQPVPRERPTLVLVHGLEGSSESGYMLGLAERAFVAGWNAMRLNQRNCGGTESLTRHALQFRTFRRLPRRPDRTHRAGFASGNFLRRLFHGRQSGAEDGGRAGEGAPPQLRGVAACVPASILGFAPTPSASRGILSTRSILCAA